MIKYIILGGACLAIVACGDSAPTQPNAETLPASAEMPQTPNVTSETPVTDTSLLGSNTGLELEDFSPSLAGRIGLENGQSLEDAKAKVLDYFGEEPSEGRYSRDEDTVYLGNGMTHIVMSHDGLLDDSVQAEQVMLVITPVSPERGEVTDFGMRIKCRRGENTGAWTTELCP